MYTNSLMSSLVHLPPFYERPTVCWPPHYDLSGPALQVFNLRKETQRQRAVVRSSGFHLWNKGKVDCLGAHCTGCRGPYGLLQLVYSGTMGVNWTDFFPNGEQRGWEIVTSIFWHKVSSTVVHLLSLLPHIILFFLHSSHE